MDPTGKREETVPGRLQRTYTKLDRPIRIRRKRAPTTDGKVVSCFHGPIVVDGVRRKHAQVRGALELSQPSGPQLDVVFRAVVLGGSVQLYVMPADEDVWIDTTVGLSRITPGRITRTHARFEAVFAHPTPRGSEAIEVRQGGVEVEDRDLKEVLRRNTQWVARGRS